jgi:hypothetical protein
MVLVLFACSLSAQALSTPPAPDEDSESVEDDEDAMTADYNARQAELFDRLREDSSPRQQVLAGRIYVGDDEGVPTALRPKREDVVARAVQLAPDDAFVQWQGAALGSYASSRCGPTTWPDAEVANLIRLEPDNAAAWQYVVALAGAKGDQAAIDEALSRMAAAPRADDHIVEQLDEWKKVFATRADAASPAARMWKDASPTAQALLSGLQQVDSDYSSAKSAVLEICKPDASSDHAWQRLGWCADAARTLATKGGSLALRRQGLELFAAIGEKSDTVTQLQRQADWLDAHGANPMRNFEAVRDAPEAIVSDWQGAKSEIAAIEHRLKRTGQPLEAPAGWFKETSSEDGDGGKFLAAMTAYRDYMKSLVDAMRTSGDVHQQVLAASSGTALAMLTRDNGKVADAAPAADFPAKFDSIEQIAAAHSNDLLVQWVAATATGINLSPESSAAAIANVQRLDSDNSAALALSLAGSTGNPEQIDAILQRMAANSRYDEHIGEMLGVWLDAIRRTPPPAGLGDMFREAIGSEMSATDSDTTANGIAMTMAYMMSTGSTPTLESCTPKDAAVAAARRADCIAIGRLQLHSAKSMLGAKFGESLLRRLDAAAPPEIARMRELAWWDDSLRSGISTGGPTLARYLDDVRASGEVEAMRLAAARAGKAEPPANWKSPAEKSADKKPRKAD